MSLPPVAYTPAGSGLVAWQSWGDADVTLLDCGIGTVFSIDDIPDEPRWLRYVSRLATFSRVVVFDYPGTGLSDGNASSWTDYSGAVHSAVKAVLDACGADRVVVMACCADSPHALQLAAAVPDRVQQLVLIDPTVRMPRGPDYPQGLQQEVVDAFLASADPLYARSGSEEPSDVMVLAPSLGGDPDFASWWTRAARRGASPDVAATRGQLLFTADLRHLLPAVACPTLVLQHRSSVLGTGMGRFIADGVADSRYVEVDGGDLVPFAEGGTTLVDEVRAFVTGSRDGGPVEREFGAVLFTDIVGSTQLATSLGDRRWRELQQAHADVVNRELRRVNGRMVQDLGDGFLCLLPSPGRAVECALALVDAVRHLGLEIRTGIHAGEIELRGEGVSGINVHIGARVSSLAKPGEVLVSSTVVDLVAGSSFRFDDRGTHEMKGITGLRQVWAVAR